jgi:Ca2+-dependent lipid-binding protein
VRRPAGAVTKLDKTKSWATFDSGIAAHMKDLYLDKVQIYHRTMSKKQAHGAVAKAAITMVSASNVKVADRTGLSDPYCVLRYHDIKHKTEVQKQTLDPEWNCTVSLPEVHEHERLVFEVWDWDAGRNADDFLGQVTLTLDEFESATQTFELQPRCGKKDRHIRGTLTIRTDYHILREAAAVAHAKAHITLHGARGLKAADKGNVSDPYAKIQCCGLQKKTAVVRRTLDPDWSFEFNVPSVAAGDACTVEVWDWDRSTKDDFLGLAVLEFDESFIDAENVELPLKSRTHKNDKNISGHVLASFRFAPQESDGLNIGRATIAIHSATNVKAADRSGTSDPFVQLIVGHGKDALKYKTEVVKRTLEPVWEHTITIDKLKAGTELVFRVYDWDRVGSDDFIGQAYVKFGALYDLDHESWPLAGREGKSDRHITGDIVLSFKFEPIAESSSSQVMACSSSSSPSN